MAQTSPEFGRMDVAEYELLESGTIDTIGTLRRKSGHGFRVENDESLWRVQPERGHSTFTVLMEDLDPKALEDFRFIWNQFYRTEKSTPLQHPSIRPISRKFEPIGYLEKDPDYRYTDDLFDLTTDHSEILARYLADLNAAVETVGGELRNGLWVASLRLAEAHDESETGQVIRLGQLSSFTATVDKPGDLRIEPVIALDDEQLLLPDDAELQGIAIKP